MEKLSLVLWRERELLESLHFQLEVEQLVLASGRTRWLMRSAKDIESTLDQVRTLEVARAVAADECAEQLGLAANPSLSDLATATDEPWSTILRDHRDALVASTREVAALAGSNRDLITAGYRSARETLMSLGEQVAGYTEDGDAVNGPGGPRRFDRVL